MMVDPAGSSRDDGNAHRLLDAGSLEDLLGLARTLAERLSRSIHEGQGAADFRLAQALSLNVLDLLETTRP